MEKVKDLILIPGSYFCLTNLTLHTVKQFLCSIHCLLFCPQAPLPFLPRICGCGFDDLVQHNPVSAKTHVMHITSLGLGRVASQNTILIQTLYHSPIPRQKQPRNGVLGQQPLGDGMAISLACDLSNLHKLRLRAGETDILHDVASRIPDI
jgi:hypothetical protein